MSQEPKYKVSQEFEIVPLKKGPAYIILVREWNHLKNRIQNIKEGSNIYYLIGTALLSLWGASILNILTGLRNTIYWVIFSCSLLSGSLLIFFGRKQKNGQSIQVKHVLEDILLVEGRFEKIEGEKTDDQMIKSAFFYDNFETFGGWVKYDEGEINQEIDFKSPNGNPTLIKDKYGDPNGGYKILPDSIETEFIFSGWVFRPLKKLDAAADRLSIEDENQNGYGFTISHKEKRVYIDQRNNGERKQISEKKECRPIQNEWYRFSFFVKKDGTLFLELFDIIGNKLVSVNCVSEEYKSFSRIAVRGGFPYYVADLKIEKL